MFKWENNNFPFFQAGAKGLPPALHIQDEQSEWRLVATFRENQAFVTFKKPCLVATTNLQKNLWIQPPPSNPVEKSEVIGLVKRANASHYYIYISITLLCIAYII